MIPLYRTHTDPAPVLQLAPDHLQRPVADTRGVRHALQNLGQAHQHSEVDPRPFVQAAGSIAAVGQGLQDLSRGISHFSTSTTLQTALAGRRQAAVDDTAANTLDTALQSAGQKYAAYMQQPGNVADPDRATAYVRTLTADLRKTALPTGMSAPLKAATEQRLAAYENKLLVDVTTRHTVHTFGQAKASFKEPLDTLLAQRQYAGYFARVDYGHSRGYFNDDELAALRQHGHDIQTGDTINDAYALVRSPARALGEASRLLLTAPMEEDRRARTLASLQAEHTTLTTHDKADAHIARDPVAARTALQQRQYDLPPADNLALQRKALTVQAAQAATVFDDLRTRIDRTGDAGTGALSPLDRSVLTPPLLQITAHYQALRQQPALLNDPALYSRTLTAIEKHDPAADTRDNGGLHHLALTQLIGTAFEGPRQAALTTALQARTTPATVPLATAFEALDQITASGQLDSPALLSGESGPPTPGSTRLDPVAWLGHDLPLPSIAAEDSASRTHAYELAASIKDDLRQQVQQGSITSTTQALQWLAGAVAGPVAASAAARFAPAPLMDSRRLRALQLLNQA